MVKCQSLVTFTLLLIIYNYIRRLYEQSCGTANVVRVVFSPIAIIKYLYLSVEYLMKKKKPFLCHQEGTLKNIMKPKPNSRILKK